MPGIEILIICDFSGIDILLTENISYTTTKCRYFSYTTGFTYPISHIPQVVFQIFNNHLLYFSNTIILSNTNAGPHITPHTHFISLIISVLVLLYSAILTTMSFQVRNTFPSIQGAKDTIKTVLAKAQESWKATHSYKTGFNITCKEITL